MLTVAVYSKNKKAFNYSLKASALNIADKLQNLNSFEADLMHITAMNDNTEALNYILEKTGPLTTRFRNVVTSSSATL